MTEVLSPDEIAKLFEAAKDGALPEGPPRRASRGRSVQRVDFSRPAVLSQSEQRRFERAHEAFCRTAGEQLSRELRASVELEVINSSQLSWGAALEDIPPSLLAVAECVPGEAIALCMEQSMVLRMIERLLGGDGDAPQPRELTELDTSIAQLVFDVALASLATVWKELLGLEPALSGFGLAGSCLEYLPPFEPTLMMTIEVREGMASSTMLVLVPRRVLALAGGRLAPGAAGAPDGEIPAGEAVGGALASARVGIRAEIGTADLTIGQVLSFAEGDLVNLGAVGDVEIRVGERPLLRARPGLNGGVRAVKVLAPLEDQL